MSKILSGVVVSNKSNKTIIVLVETRKTHPIYKKQYTRSRRIAAHDENNSVQVGDRVNIVETRPISATKRFKLVEVVAKAGIEHIEELPEVVAVKPKKSPVSQKDAEEVKESADANLSSGALAKEEAMADKETK